VTRGAGRLLGVVVKVASYAVLFVAAVLMLATAVLPPLLHYQPYIVLSGSMAPAIPTGSVVFAKAVPPGAIQVGDVITYNRSDVGETITHRVVERFGSDDQPTFVTRGDANPVADSWTVNYLVNPAGKVVLAIPGLGYLHEAVRSPLGRFGLIIMPSLVLAIMWLAHVWRQRIEVSRREDEAGANAAPASSRSSIGSDSRLSSFADSAQQIPLRR